MTAEDRRSILDAMHSLELRVVERLARLEGKVEGQHELKRRINALESCEAQQSARVTRLTVALVAVAIIATGDGFLRVIALIG
jgi:hypothetical protein